MTCDIFIKTCQHDAGYHQHCLASIEKFCSGFRRTVVIDGEHPRGYLHQQVVKLHADIHTGADFTLVTDSDTLFTAPVTPESFFTDGKVDWLVTPWDETMLAHAGTRTWYDVMGQFHGKIPPFEFMRRQPFMLPRWLTESIRDWCKFQHGQDIETYVMGHGTFSEFNVLGHHAWLFHQSRFNWIDTSKEELPPPVVRQFWSHDPIEKNIEEINHILA